MAQPNTNFTTDTRFDPNRFDNDEEPVRAKADEEVQDENARRQWTVQTDGQADTEGWQRWQQLKANFVDDPRSAVAEAHGIVSDTIHDIVEKLEGECRQVEQSWSNGKDASTEDLRRSLQRYRDLFGRLIEQRPKA